MPDLGSGQDFALETPLFKLEKYKKDVLGFCSLTCLTLGMEAALGFLKGVIVCHAGARSETLAVARHASSNMSTCHDHGLSDCLGDAPPYSVA